MDEIDLSDIRLVHRISLSNIASNPLDELNSVIKKMKGRKLDYVTVPVNLQSYKKFGDLDTIDLLSSIIDSNIAHAVGIELVLDRSANADLSNCTEELKQLYTFLLQPSAPPLSAMLCSSSVFTAHIAHQVFLSLDSFIATNMLSTRPLTVALDCLYASPSPQRLGSLSPSELRMTVTALTKNTFDEKLKEFARAYQACKIVVYFD